MATARSVWHTDQLGAAARLLVDFNTEYGDPAPTPAWLAGHLARLVARGDTGVYLVGDPACGVAVVRFRTSTWSSDLEAYLAELYVQPDRRGQGLGRALLTYLVEDARRRGATYLDVTTTEAEAAVHLYEAFGFDCHEGRGSGPRSLYFELDL